MLWERVCMYVGNVWSLGPAPKQPQRPIGLNGLIGLRGLISALLLGGVRSCTTVRVVLTVLKLPSLWLRASFFLFPPDCAHFCPWLSMLTLDGLLLSELETFLSSCDSTAVELWPSALLGGTISNSIYSCSVYTASVLQPFQQSLQSHTKNLKQNASIFMHGWKQIHRFLKSILFFSECASRRERWQVMAKSR